MTTSTLQKFSKGWKVYPLVSTVNPYKNKYKKYYQSAKNIPCFFENVRIKIVSSVKGIIREYYLQSETDKSYRIFLGKG